MDIELWNKDTKAIIDQQGAWVTSLSDERGDILYPKRLLLTVDGKEKARGGCHVCLPNFGPGGDAGLPQHGYGRTKPWELISQDNESVVLGLTGGAKGYEQLGAVLTYRLGPQSIECLLEVHNGDKTEDVHLAPAFHPYFMVPADNDEVKVNAAKQLLDGLDEAIFFKNSAMICETGARMITIRSRSLSTWALWTDRLGSYVCVEPTFGGFSFERPGLPVDILRPGEKKQYDMQIEW